MTYALVQDDTIVQQGALPNVWNDGTRDWDLRPMSDPELAQLGWHQIVTVAQPPNTDTTTHDHSLDVVDGLPTDVWTPRPWTADELAANTRQVNSQTIVAESGANVDKLIAAVEALNTITSMTNAEINANPAAVIKDLARECKTIARQVNHGARFVSGETDSTYTGPP